MVLYAAFIPSMSHRIYFEFGAFLSVSSDISHECVSTFPCYFCVILDIFYNPPFIYMAVNFSSSVVLCIKGGSFTVLCVHSRTCTHHTHTILYMLVAVTATSI